MGWGLGVTKRGTVRDAWTHNEEERSLQKARCFRAYKIAVYLPNERNAIRVSASSKTACFTLRICRVLERVPCHQPESQKRPCVYLGYNYQSCITTNAMLVLCLDPSFFLSTYSKERRYCSCPYHSHTLREHIYRPLELLYMSS